MPRPKEGEPEQTFVSRFMESEEARRDYPDEKQRAAVAYSMWKERTNALGQKGDLIPMRFIEPGLVHYEDIGTVLVKKETLDGMAQSFVGKPVFNESHKDVSSKDFSSGRADGIVTRVWYDPHDAWYWADVMVWDPETKENCRNGYSLSCAYDVNKWSEQGGIHNNIPYAREVLDGEYTHLAIVPNPRYEGARIIYNTKGGNMKFAFWKKDKPEVSEIDGDKAVLNIDGKEVPVGQLVELFNSSEKEKAASAAADALKNASDDDTVEIGGKKVTIGDLKNAYLAKERANAEADEDDDEEKKKKKERENAEEKERKEREEEDRKNAEEKKKDEDDERERKNSEHFDRMRERANSRDGKFEIPKIMTTHEREAEGSKRYGSSGK